MALQKKTAVSWEIYVARSEVFNKNAAINALLETFQSVGLS